MMTREDFVEMMNEYDRLCKQEVQISDSLGISEWWGLEVLDSYYQLMSKTLDLPYNEKIGTDLDYYVFECYSSDKPWVIGPLVIDSYEKLWDYIIEPECRLKRFITDEEVIEMFNANNSTSESSEGIHRHTFNLFEEDDV